MNLCVLFDTTERIELCVPLDSDVLSLKVTIAELRKCSIPALTLLFNGTVLSDETKLAALSLPDRAIIVCHIMMANDINDMIDPSLIEIHGVESILQNLKDDGKITKPWTEEENELLRAKVAELGTKWKKISQYFLDRSYSEIVHHWKKDIKSAKDYKQIPWKEEEEQMLTEKVNELGRKWSQIATFFDRTPRALEGHWEKIMNTGKNMTTKPWTDEEDERLAQKVKEFGTKWTHLASFFERTPKALERHWSKKMVKEKKTLPHEQPHPWTPEEEEQLKQKVNELGTNWSAIAQFFDRTPGGIKLQWYRIKRRGTTNDSE